MDKDIHQIQKRFMDLANKSYGQGCFTFTDFLGLAEQDAFHRMERELVFAGFCLWGGFEGADRVIFRFGNPEEFGYDVEFPISCIHIKPLSAKFADKLTHRDFLGALMNLGIERSVLGDIKVGDKEAYLFCKDEMVPFICENLVQVKHTNVVCKEAEYRPLPEEEPKVVTLQVSSLRADAVIAKVINQSRSEVLAQFTQGKVYLNGRLLESNAKTLKETDVVNVRGEGKFIVQALEGETRKGKLCIKVAVYA